MSKKFIVVAGLIAVVVVTGVVAVGLSNNSSPDGIDNSSSIANDGETENENITGAVQTDWNGSALTITVTSEGEANEIDARGDVKRTRSIDSRVGKSIELSCRYLSASSGTVDVVAVDDNQVNTLESVEYSGC